MMEQWTIDVWAAIGVGFIIGAIIGCALVKIFHGGVKRHRQLETELKQAKTRVDEQKQKLEQHFEQSAQLLSTLAEDYKKLYTHLAQSSDKLLPDGTHNIKFFQQSLPPMQSEKTEEGQPRDYSEGSSGLLKE